MRAHVTVDGSRPHWRRALPAILLSLAFAHNVWFSWLKWGDPLVDSGYELEVARTLADGKILYRDVRWGYGPLAPYVNAILFDAFGVHAGVLLAAGIASAALGCALVYRMARRFAERWPATLAAAAFLYVCAFAHLTLNGIFNFVLPFTYAATYGVLLAMASVLALVRHVQRGGARDFYFSLLLWVLAGATRIEVVFAASAAHAAFLLSLAFSRSLRRSHLLSYVAATATLVLVYATFYATVGQAVFQDSFGAIAAGRYSHYLAQNLGVTDLKESLAKLAYSVAVAAGVCAVGWIASRCLGRLRGAQNFAAAALMIGAAAVAAYVYLKVSTDIAFRCVPLLLAASIAWCAVRWFRDPASRPRMLPAILLCSFALAMLARMLLKTISYHYGFFMLVPGLVVFVIAWCVWAPQALCRSERERKVMAFQGAALIVALIVAHYRVSAIGYSMRTAHIHTRRGSSYLLANDAIGETIQWLATLPPKTRVLTVPSGHGLIFFGGTDNALLVPNLLPQFLADRREERRVIKALAAAPPDVILFPVVNVGEFGVTGFGIDYGLELAAWIRARYRTLRVQSPTNSVVALVPK